MPERTTWAELQRDAAARIAPMEARWIVESVSGLRGAELLANVHEPVPIGAVQRVDDLVARRVGGEPLQYVIGEWEFRGIDVFVDPRVLIPRPETEVTAQAAIDVAAELGARRGRGNPWTGIETEFSVVDLGTGSGAIAIALAAELPDAEVWATDVSDDALAVARANIAGAGHIGTRIRVAQGDWFAALPDALRGRVRVVVANPPYISEEEIDDLPPEVIRHEPRVALVSGPTGLEAIERIVADAPAWLESGLGSELGGALVVEIAPSQGEPVIAFALAAGFADARVQRDLTGRDRVLVARVS